MLSDTELLADFDITVIKVPGRVPIHLLGCRVDPRSFDPPHGSHPLPSAIISCDSLIGECRLDDEIGQDRDGIFGCYALMTIIVGGHWIGLRDN